MSIIYRKENKEFPLRQPAAATNADGQPRSIGVEIELGGLDLDQITNRIQQVVGGEVERRSNYEGKVRGTRIGDIAVELDAQLFTDIKVRGMLDKLGLENIEPYLSRNDSIGVGFKRKNGAKAWSDSIAWQLGKAVSFSRSRTHQSRAACPSTASFNVALPWARLKTAARVNSRQRSVTSSHLPSWPSRRCSSTHRL